MVVGLPKSQEESFGSQFAVQLRKVDRQLADNVQPSFIPFPPRKRTCRVGKCRPIQVMVHTDMHRDVVNVGQACAGVRDLPPWTAMEVKQVVTYDHQTIYLDGSGRYRTSNRKAA